jgi:hypothetical protein
VYLQWTTSVSKASKEITPFKMASDFQRTLVGYHATSESEETFFIKLLVQSEHL